MRKSHLTLLVAVLALVGALLLTRPPGSRAVRTALLAPAPSESARPPSEVPAGLVSGRGGAQPEVDFPDRDLLLVPYPGLARVRRTRWQEGGRTLWAATFSSGVGFERLRGYYQTVFKPLGNQKLREFASDAGRVVTFSATTAHDHLEVSLQEDRERGVTIIRHFREHPPGPA